jgi:pectin methylesterase-like acyl-CoA thioesterase
VLYNCTNGKDIDKNPLIGKCLVVGIILLLTGASIIPTTAQNGEKPSLPTSSGHWLYVGGSGPGNYTRIQEAIDNASNGDTVFVYNGTYNENILEQMSSGVITVDKNMVVTTFNKRAQEISGVLARMALENRIEMIHKPFHVF